MYWMQIYTELIGCSFTYVYTILHAANCKRNLIKKFQKKNNNNIYHRKLIVPSFIKYRIRLQVSKL